jgi:DNA-binding transcriptional MerR regulator
MDTTWRIQQLAETAALALETMGATGQPSARVRDVPDLRTIRYYTTLGLLDRPLEMRGRVAYYGWRHLWQLLAIKRLQTEGTPLVEIQSALAGASDRTLTKLARVPDGFALRLASAANRSSADKGSPMVAAPRIAAFWAETPALADEPQPAAPRQVDSQRARLGDDLQICAPVTPSVSLTPAQHIQLDQDVTLVIEGEAAARIDGSALAELVPSLSVLTDALRRLGIACRDAPSLAKAKSTSSTTTSRN